MPTLTSKRAHLLQAMVYLKIRRAAEVTGAELHSFAGTAFRKGCHTSPVQGRCVGRDGRVAIEFEDDTIWLGGYAVTCIEGSLKI